MTTVGELRAALRGYADTARVCVLVDCAAAAEVCDAREEAEQNIDTVEPIGCNVFDVQITLGGSR